jgi:predicted RNA-binding Zn-ribbon protein involved in translation (DUF1610 family)
MHLELENLINMALADGEVTEKERAIILRKAEALGEDKDEVEMIIDGKLALLKKIHEADFLPNTLPAPPLETKSNKEGDLKKCPSCGAPVNSFNTKCPECGHEFKNVKASNSATQLYEALNEAANSDIKLTGITALFGDPYQKERAIANKKITIISNFPVPNSKEDLFEFLILAISEIGKPLTFMQRFQMENPDRLVINSWKAKSEQVIRKARMSFKDDKKSLAEIEVYAKQLGIKK